MARNTARMIPLLALLALFLLQVSAQLRLAPASAAIPRLVNDARQTLRPAAELEGSGPVPIVPQIRDLTQDIDAASLEKAFKEVKDGEFDVKTFQLEGISRGEIEMEEIEDERLDSDNVPSDALLGDDVNEVQDQVTKVLENERSIRGRSHLAEKNPYAAYSVSQSLFTWRCCPRRQGYGCRHYRRRLPCFYSAGSICCPVYPSSAIYTAYCNCSKCAVLTNYCASVGRCQRRYTTRRFLAVCRRSQSSFWTARWFRRRVATSCYCRTHC